MVIKLLRYGTKFKITTLIVGTLTYNCHQEINKIVNDIKFYLNKSEPGFVEREQAFDLEINYKLNGKGNLETYLENYSEKLSILSRYEGVMVGSAEYNYKNFTENERATLCKTNPKNKKLKSIKKEENFLKRTLKRLYDLGN